MRSTDLTTYEEGARLATFEVTFFVEDLEKLKAKFAKTELARIVEDEVDEDGNPYPFNSAQAILEIMREAIDMEDVGIAEDGACSHPDLVINHG